MSQFPQSAAQTVLPSADAVVAGAVSVTLVSADGEIETLSHADLTERLDGPPLLMCHARSLARRVGRNWIAGLDVLELFAFVHPARFCRPTPEGLSAALDLPPPGDAAGRAVALHRITGRLLTDLAAHRDEPSDPVAIAWTMGQGGWPWARFVLAALGSPAGTGGTRSGLEVWHRLPEWQSDAPPPPPTSQPVTDTEARKRLALLRGRLSEERPQQADYASAVAQAFDPKPDEETPITVLAEAGTGVGKTLGYLAPATVWAEKNGAPVWISTFTRNLQHQIDQELERLVPDPVDKARRVVIRKGRENYLCLLNLDDAVKARPTQPHTSTALGLVARWAAATRDGDLQGGDLPGWLADLVGRGRSLGLGDRRGECIYSACPHHQKCFIERSVRRARRADIVIANHALVMIQAALGGIDDQNVPTRLIFDEGHHLFDAADSAFSSHLTAREAAELRRWLIGSDVARRSRARGLRRRIEDLLANDEEAMEQLDELERAARTLPAEAWSSRLRSRDTSEPTESVLTEDGLHGAAERFLMLVRQQVYARAKGRDGPYDLETDATPPIDGILEAASGLRASLARLQKPMQALARRLKARLEDEAETLDSNTRQRLEASARGLERRARDNIGPWIAMLDALADISPDHVVDWFGVERIEGRDIDVGYYRHALDPTQSMMASLAGPTHGMAITSATLTDGTGDVEQDWTAAEVRTGTAHLGLPAIRARVPSPFDYAGQTRVLIVRDVRKDDLDQVAAAYRALIEAAGGGTLGLFTAISRLRAVHGRLAPTLEAAGLPLFAQHVDGMDVSTLVDIFRGEEDASLLGTDAVRDGVDIPGRSLRLIVFDRVPWPRPSILQRARAAHFGKQRYTDMLTRLRLKQAFGRLVRRADDRGVFILLDPMMPTRLTGAFPEGVEVERLGLAEAVEITRGFLAATAEKQGGK